MMRQNAHQFSDIIRLAGKLGVDQVNFKNCDVIRTPHGQDRGLMARSSSEPVQEAVRELERALRLAEKLQIETTGFSLLPDE